MSQGNETLRGNLKLGLIPLAFWPFLLIPNAMSLGAVSDPRTSLSQRAVAAIFLLGSLAYPIALAVAALVAFVLSKMGQHDWALRISRVPLFYSMTVLMAFLLWIVQG